AIDPAESEERPSWISAVRSSILPNEPSDSQDSESPIGDIHGKTVGAYKLVEVIGRGGMGIVCRAIHQHLGRVVAIKLILKSAAANAAERFEREMRSIGELHHPAIVQATDAGTADGRAYLAMEL